MSAAKYVGWPVGADQHPVLVVPEGRRPKPGGALIVVHVAGGPELLDGRGHLPRLVQLALGSVHVDPHPEPTDGALDVLVDPVPGPLADGLQRVDRCDDLLGHLRRQLTDVCAAIPGLARLPGPRQVDRLAEVPDLAAVVVHVVLAPDRRPGRLQQVRQRVTDEAAAPVADVERPGRVGADELDVEPLGREPVGPPPVGTGGLDGRHLGRRPTPGRAAS